MLAADGGLLVSFQSNVKASVFITSFSFGIYVIARLTGPLVRDRRSRRRRQGRPASQEATRPRAAPDPAGSGAGNG